MIYGSDKIGDDDNDSGDSVGGKNVYQDNREKLVLVSLSDPYLELCYD